MTIPFDACLGEHAAASDFDIVSNTKDTRCPWICFDSWNDFQRESEGPDRLPNGNFLVASGSRISPWTENCVDNLRHGLTAVDAPGAHGCPLTLDS